MMSASLVYWGKNKEIKIIIVKNPQLSLSF